MTAPRTMTIALAVAFAVALAGRATTAITAAGRPTAGATEAPAARLADLGWLAGRWEGTGIDGGAASESYSPPAGGQIVGHFRQLTRDGSVMFYEIMTIAEVGKTLHFRVKHFNPDMTGWEEKERVVSFPLVAVTRDAWIFNGLTLRRVDANAMVATVRIRDAAQKERELTFRYRRVSGQKQR